MGKSRLRPRGVSRVLLVGCGTSYQLAQAAACNFESVCDVPAFAYSAGEFCAGGVVCDRGALVVGISASGQTAEVAEALQKAAAFGARTTRTAPWLVPGAHFCPCLAACPAGCRR